MRKHIDIQLGDHSVQAREVSGDEAVRAGRYLIAKTLIILTGLVTSLFLPGIPLGISQCPRHIVQLTGWGISAGPLEPQELHLPGYETPGASIARRQNGIGET